MANIVVADKQSTQLTQNAWGNISLQNPSLVQMPVSPNQVATVTRQGQDLIVTLKSGEKVTVGNFFAVNPEGVASDMVFVGEDGTLWHAVYDADAFTGFTFENVASLDELMADVGVVGNATSTFAIAGLSLLGVGGAAAAAGGGGGGGGGGGDGTPGDTTAPASPTDLLLSADGLRLSGLGEAGATVFVRDAAGNVLATGTVAGDGTFSVALDPAVVDGSTLQVGLTDAAGNASPDTPVTSPDLTAPAAPADLALADGTTLTGAGEPGATVEVRDATGAIVGTGVVGDDGRFSLAITPALTNGEPLDVRQVDAAGNSSTPTVFNAPDTTPPAILSDVVVGADGVGVSGRGEPGARVEVRDADGNLIGTGTVADNGSFVLSLDTPVTAGQSINLIQFDTANNPSENVQFTVPVTPTPAAPADVVVASDGSSISGTAPVGSQVEVRDNTGTVIGSVVVGADGGFTIGLTPPLTNGERVDVVVVDGNGASSLPVQITAPDTTAPAAPSELAVSANGEQLTGRGEPGSSVRVVDADGNELGTAVVNDAGSFSITLDPPQVAGQLLQVSASDVAGNTSGPVGVGAPNVGNPGGDTTPPEAASDVLVSADGRTVSGRGEAGTSVQVRDAAGNVLATGTVAGDGTFSVALDPAVVDGSTLQVGLTDAAGNASPDTPVTSPDLTAPAAPADLALADGTTLTGAGEPGATVEVRDATGAIVGTGVVGDDGRFSLDISPAFTNGEPLDIRQVDAAGNSSSPVVLDAPDTTPPAILTDVVVGADGIGVSGRGEPGARVEVRDADGNLIGTGTVADNGSFVLTLDTPVSAGDDINLIQFDTANNPSAPLTFTIPATPAPAAPTGVVLADDGSSISGTAPVGSQVQVRDNTGAVIGSVVVGADGGFTIGLTPPLTNGELVDVVAVDGTGASSLPVQITAPDTTAPAAPSELAVSANGEQLFGRGEPGSSVRVVDADGNQLGTAVVNDAGSFSITLDPPQVDGQLLQVSAFDATGNTSAAVGIGAPDIGNPGADTTPPDAPTELAISTDGRTVSGRGEAGATVDVLDAEGTVIATGTVLEDGSFNLQLDPPVIDGSDLQVTLTDAAGNVSTGAPLAAPDSAAPAQPTDILLADGVTLSGNAEAGARLEVRDATGTLIGAIVVAADGSFSVPLAPAQNNAEILDIRVIDAAGNISTPLAFTAPDNTAPGIITDVVVGADGLAISGRGEAGAVVEVRDADGTLIGSGTVGDNGTFLFNLDTPVAAGDGLSLVQIDPAGNDSDALAVTVPIAPAPASPADLVLAGDGSSISGSAPVGTLVQVLDAQGAVLGSVVAGDGTFTIALAPPQANGEILDVVAIDTDGNSSLPTQATAPDITAPNAPTDLVLNPDGLTLIGRGEPGATVQVTNDQGASVGSGVVGDNGVFSITLAPAQTDGQVLDVTLNDGADNASASASITAPDLDGPLQPSGFAIDIGGTVLTGVGQAGSTVTVRSADGTVLGTTSVAADGSFTVTLSEPQRNGQVLSAEATDSRGNSAGPVSYSVPDVQAPDPVTEQAIDAAGAVVSGRGEAGATVIVRGPDGAELGRSVVNPDGSFQVGLATGQTNAQALTVEQQDVAGNVSAPVGVTAPDTEIPLAPTGLALSADGTVLTGTGEAGATVTVTGTAGAVLGTGVVQADGTFSVTLVPAQLNGQTVSATQADAIGNLSLPEIIVAVDLEAPLAPLGAALDAAGAVITGQGEPGTAVEVRNAAGDLIGEGEVLADGSFSVTLDTPQTNGQVLSIELVDGAGYRSPAASVTAADTTPADAPTGLAINADGSVVTGTGQPGATVQVLNAAGAVLSTLVIAPDGSFAVTLDPPQQDGQVLSVNQIDDSGIASPATPIATPDLAAPATPDGLAVSEDGNTLTGTSPGATSVTVRDAAGAELITVPTNADGSFTATLPAPLTNGELLTVVTTDATGNISDSGTVAAPDTTPPDAATDLTLSPGGDLIAGTAEPGATVIVRSGATDINSVVAGPDGSFVIPVTPALGAADVVQVVVRDPAGNETPVDLAGPDGTEVATPTALALSDDGFLLTGQGTVGSLITVTSAGSTLGTATVGNDGVFRVFFFNAQLNAQTLQVNARFAAGGKPSVPASIVAEDTTAPEALTDIAVDRSGSLLTGRGEVGATVNVLGPDNVLVGSAVVGSNGLFSVALAPPQVNAQALTVTQTDAAGNASLAVPATAPDLDAPPIPAGIVLNAAGTVVSGQGEVGATVVVRDASGVELGTGLVNQNGTFQVTLPSAQATGSALQVTLTDTAGNTSAPASLATPDRMPPVAVDQLLLSGDGRQLTGLGEVGATVQVRNAAGTVVGSATVGADGRFSVLFDTPQNAGQPLGVTQVDAAANTSPAVLVTTPDLTAPAPLSNVVLNNNGLTLTGLGEAGATVTVAGPDGTIVGTGLVAANGSFTLTLDSAQLNAERLTVTQTDAGNNTSAPLPVTAPDVTPPAAPVALLLASTGAQLTGNAEAGSTVTVRDASGTVLGTALATASGTFQVSLSSAQTNGQALQVTATDAAGNVSLAASLTAADTTPPAAVSDLVVSADGATLAGYGEAGASVTVSAVDGTPLGTALVGTDGYFTVALAPAAATGDILSVVQTDAALNASPAGTVAAPGTLAPEVPANLAVSADGLTVSGTGTPGSTVNVYGPNGVLLGSAVVADAGTFAVALGTAQGNGETLQVGAVGTDGSASLRAELIAPDFTAPQPLTQLVLSSDGLVLTGRGEAGATVSVLGEGGLDLGTSVVNADGTFTVNLSAAQINGEELSASQSDATGNESNSVSLVAPDRVAPDAPVALAFVAGGTLLNGTGEAGASISVISADGTPVGSGIVREDGTFQVELTPAQANGETLRVLLTDAAGNQSEAGVVTALDTTAPALLTELAVSGDGVTLTGRGEPGAEVTVLDAASAPVGTAIVDASGQFTLVLDPPLGDAQVLRLTQTDLAGNVSPQASLVTPDFTPPAVLTNVIINADGSVVSGNGEAGATVTVSNPAGVVVGTSTVLADGTFRVELDPPQINLEPLSVQQADPPGNVSDPVGVVAPDLTPPAAPENLRVNAAGTQLGGTGEPGTTVQVTTFAGEPVGTATVGDNGTFLVDLAPIQTNGGQLLVTLVDASDNVSPQGSVLAVDITAPVIASATLNADGSQLSGTSEAGARLTVINDSGDLVGSGVVDPDGTFVLTLLAPQQDGQLLTVTAQDATGNPSAPFTVAALDTTAPVQPGNVLLALDGITLTGTGEPDSALTVRGPDNAIVGTGTVGPDGNFLLLLDPAQTNGQSLTVVSTDQAGNSSLPQTVVAADTTVPDPVTELNITSGYTLLSGRGQPGALVSVSQDGELIGSATVLPDGTFGVTLPAGLGALDQLDVVQADTAGPSQPATFIVPVTPAPDAPFDVVLSADGLTVSGTAASGITVQVRDAEGTLIATGVAQLDGAFSIPLPEAQLNGEVLEVVAVAIAGGDSQPFVLQATDITAPDAPVVTALSANGLVLTGTGEAGATVTVTAANGDSLGTAVVNEGGVFSVNLASAQLNGQVLGVTQADAAENVSGTTRFTAPDVQAPLAPTNLVLDAAGVTLTGNGEPGATVSVTGAGPAAITGVVAPDGTFSITLPAQIDGQVLSVRQSDLAGNRSASSSLTAQDLTPPLAPTAAINELGTLVTGTGQAGATVIVTNAITGLQVGSAVVGSNGAFTVSLPTAQVNFESLTVTQQDLGGTSPGTPLTAPDFTPPAVASEVTVNAGGTLLEGTGEVGATVSVRLADGTLLPSTVVQPDGTFRVTLSPVQDNGQRLSVTLTDPRGNVSGVVSVTAPDVDADREVTASDNLATAVVDLIPVTASQVFTDSFTTLLSGFTKTFTWTVGANTTADPVLTLTTNSALALLDNALFTLQVKDASGAWVTLATGNSPGLLDLVLLPLGQGIQADLGTLRAGEYRLTVGSSGIGLLTTVDTSLDITSTSLDQFNGTGTPLDGNVLTDPGVDGTVDITGPDNGAVVQVLQFGNYVNAAAGVTVQGLYGSLVLRGDGSYTYTPNGSASSVGKVDVFSYQLAHPNGLTDAATLYVRIDSPQAAEIWSNPNLAAPAVVVDAISDLDNTNISLVAREASTSESLGTLPLPLIGQRSATYTTTVAADTTADLQVVLTSNNILALLNGATIELLRLNPATGQYVSVQTAGGATLVNLLGNSAGFTFQDQGPGAYQIRVTAGGIGLASSVATSLNTTTTFNNELVVGNYTPVIGNLLTDTSGGRADYQGSALTVLSVLVAANTFVNPGQNGVSMAGTYGTLYVQADGTYTYLLKTGLTSAVIGQSDTFTYELTHPNGTSDTATLTINLDNAATVTTTSALLSDTSDDNGLMLASLASATVTGETIAGTDGNDRLDGSQGGAVTLQGGAGDDTLVIVDQDFASVDGGSGTDTLLWAGGDASIDLGNLVGRLHDIEVIDLNDTSAVSLSLSLADVIAVTDSASDTLVIKGGSEDSLTLEDNWTLAGNETADGVDYIQYVAQEDPSHHLWVQNSINVV